MNKFYQFLINIFLIALTFSTGNVSRADELNYSEIVKNIGNEISALQKNYPQLVDFSPAKHVQLKSLEISYEYKTHEPARAGGWTSGVPNPDPDGIWFYIDFHDPQSTAQIHTQPIVTKGIIGKKEVMFLILEGDNTKRLHGKIWEILKKNGVAVKEGR